VEILKLTLTKKLFRHFDWCLARPEAPWKEHNFMGIFTHSDMWVLAIERNGAV
jgi:hypothetical protein